MAGNALKGEMTMTNRIGTALLVVLFLGICSTASAQVTYTTKLTSGPFLVAPTAASVDWVLLNNDPSPADVRVTVYELTPTGKVTVGGFSVTLHLASGATAHNANSVGTLFFVGGYYEVVVESTSENVHPNVNQWSSNGADGFIPETLIPAGSFTSIKLPKPPKP